MAVAEAIEKAILDAKWPVGQVLGSETELLGRLGVSRAVFREAMRVVEKLFLHVLIELTTPNHVTADTVRTIRRARDRRAMAEDIHRAHSAIAEAVISGDAALAQHRMQRHLVAMERWLS